MEASALRQPVKPGLLIRSPALLRLYGDERLVAAIRGGNARAFEVLFERYRAKLLAFCRGMVGTKEDGEDVLQEVFVAAHSAMLADSRPLSLKPWLYRIARNRCLNHLRRPRAEGQDTMDDLPDANGASSAEATAAGREEIRAIFADVRDLPETQRTALILRELDDLSYEEIAAAMDTSLAAVKSLLVRARMQLAEASESRVLTCDEVRLHLAEAAEGVRKVGGGVRHHVRRCSECERYRGELRSSSRELRALTPFAPFAFLATLRHALGAKLSGGGGSAAASSGGAGAGGAGAAGSAGVAGGAGAGGAGVGAAGAGSLGSAGLIGGGALGAVGMKAAGGLAAATLFTAGAVGVSSHSHTGARVHTPAVTWTAPISKAPVARYGLPHAARPAAAKAPAVHASKTAATDSAPAPSSDTTAVPTTDPTTQPTDDATAPPATTTTTDQTTTDSTDTTDSSGAAGSPADGQAAIPTADPPPPPDGSYDPSAPPTYDPPTPSYQPPPAATPAGDGSAVSPAPPAGS